MRTWRVTRTSWIGDGESDGAKQYEKAGGALSPTGQEKVSAALAISSVLSDGRFDFLEANVVVVGCACVKG